MSHQISSTLSQMAENLSSRRVCKLILCLNKKEKRQFDQWLSIELDGKQEHLTRLFNQLITEKDIVCIWPALFPTRPIPEKPLSDSYYRKIENQLTNYIEEFLAIQDFRKNKPQRDLHLIKAINKYGDGNLFNKTLKKVKKRLKKGWHTNMVYYRILYELALEQKGHSIRSIQRQKESLKIQEEINNTFLSSFLHEKLLLDIANLNFTSIYGKKPLSFLTKEGIEYIKSNVHIKKFPLLHIYICLYNLLTAQEYDPEKVLEMLKEHQAIIDKSECQNILILMLNHYTRQANATDEENEYQKLAKLYKWGIDNELLLIGGYLPWNHYKNLITVNLRLMEQNVIEPQIVLKYINHYRQYIAPEDEAEAYRFNLAQYYYFQKDYQNVKIIYSNKFSNVFYEMHGRLYLVQAQYEEGIEPQELEIPLRSLRVFIQSQKRISSKHKTSYINRIRLFECLLKTSSLEDLEKLLENVHNTSPLNNRVWLIDKIKAKIQCIL